ncbi:MAG: hypothetical protein ACR2GY_08475 [Phycisphaerales bacterium]
MKPKLDFIGSAVGVLGAALCLLAAMFRFLAGSRPDFLRMTPMTMFMGGIALLVFACWVKLESK